VRQWELNDCREHAWALHILCRGAACRNAQHRKFGRWRVTHRTSWGKGLPFPHYYCDGNGCLPLKYKARRDDLVRQRAQMDRGAT